MKRVFLFFLTILLVSISVFSQKTSNLVLIHGKIIDEFNNPIGVELYIINDANEQIKIKSNSSNGEFSQIVSPNNNYRFFIKNYYLIQNSDLSVPNYGEYKELNITIKAKKININDEIFSCSAFLPNKDEINTKEINKIIDFFKFQKNMNFSLLINSNDSKFSPLKKKIQSDGKKKNQTKQITISAKDQATELSERRAKIIKDYLIKNSIFERNFNVEVSKNYQYAVNLQKQNTNQKQTKQSLAPNVPINTLSVKVTKLAL